MCCGILGARVVVSRVVVISEAHAEEEAMGALANTALIAHLHSKIREQKAGLDLTAPLGKR